MAQELQDKLGGLDAASRDAALSAIFGSDAMRAATVMMDSGTEGLRKYIDAANDQEAAQRLANSQMSDGSRAIEELKRISGNRSDSDWRYTGTNCPEGSRTYYRTCQ